jgi:hypothetical protein
MTYIIKDDETLLDILNRFGIELEDLLKYNNINGMMLQSGSRLQIPVKREDEEEDME